MIRTFLSGLLLFVFLSPLISLAQVKDSIKTTLLNEVKITDSFSKDSLSKQSSSALDSTVIKKIPFISVGDMAKYIAGVSVRDYGGVGGLKT
ncbi:MAG: vitamin B12 receptor, partial [Bacteroidales bacterium]